MTKFVVTVHGNKLLSNLPKGINHLELTKKYYWRMRKSDRSTLSRFRQLTKVNVSVWCQIIQDLIDELVRTENLPVRTNGIPELRKDLEFYLRKLMNEAGLIAK